MIQWLSELIPDFVTGLLFFLECCFLLRGCCCVVVFMMFVLVARVLFQLGIKAFVYFHSVSTEVFTNQPCDDR